MAKPTQDEVLDIAWKNLRHIPPQSLAADSGAKLMSGGKRLLFGLMDRQCSVDLVTKEIVYASERPTAFNLYLQILVLHYLAGAGKAQVANRLVSFRDFEGGALYYSAFKERAIDVIAKEFGTKPEILKHIGEVLRAESVRTGTVGMKIHFFPKLPVVVALWVGDEEVPASANILFDANAGKMLPTEDLSVVGGAVARRVVEISKR
ncbi:MAG: hypothetical protein A3K67_04000 [Euryarchaeota archaeon RBG_16_62_10]|nr:MAG: hypothetical protein A3K67_04000 [Euryarchaeota archaeon RBG_16_62_10]